MTEQANEETIMDEMSEETRGDDEETPEDDGEGAGDTEDDGDGDGDGPPDVPRPDYDTSTGLARAFSADSSDRGGHSRHFRVQLAQLRVLEAILVKQSATEVRVRAIEEHIVT